MKIIVIANLFSGLNSIIKEGEFVNKGSPAYYNFIKYISQHEKCEIIFLQTQYSKKNKFIENIHIKKLKKNIKLIGGFNYLYKLKYGAFLNKFIQYILIFYTTNILHKKSAIYIDRDNILFSYMLTLFNKKNTVRFLGVNENFYAHIFHKNNLYSKIIKYIFNNHNVMKVFTKDGSYSELCEKFPNSHLLFNGIDKHEYRCPNFEEFTISYVGRLEKCKGQRVLLNTMLLLKESGIKVNIIGDGSDRVYLQNFIDGNSLHGNVKIIGNINQEDIYSYLSNSSLFISINYLGIYGNTLLEASSTGLPIIALNHSYFNDINKKYFYLISENNVTENLKDAILYFYNKECNIKLYSKKSYEFSRSLYTWKDRIKLEIAMIKKNQGGEF